MERVSHITAAEATSISCLVNVTRAAMDAVNTAVQLLSVALGISEDEATDVLNECQTGQEVFERYGITIANTTADNDRVPAMSPAMAAAAMSKAETDAWLESIRDGQVSPQLDLAAAEIRLAAAGSSAVIDPVSGADQSPADASSDRQ